MPSIQESPVQQQPATTFFFRSRCAAADETIGDQLGFEASLEPPVPFAAPQLYFMQPDELVLPSEYMSAAAAVADLDPSFLLKPAVAAAAAPRAGIWRPVWLVLERPILVVLQLMRRVLFPLKCWSPCLQQSPLLQLGHDDHQHLSISFFPSGGPSSPGSHSQIAAGILRSPPYPPRQPSPRRWQHHGPRPRRHHSLLRYRRRSPLQCPHHRPRPFRRRSPRPFRRCNPLQWPHHSARRCRHRTARLLFVWLATRRASACLGLCLVRTPLTSRARASRPREFWQSLRLREADAEARRRQCLHNLRICYVLPLRCRWALGRLGRSSRHCFTYVASPPPFPSSSLATRRAFVCLGLRLECALLISRLCLPPQQRSSWPVSSRDTRSTWPKLFELGPLYLSLGALGEYVRPSQSRDRSLHGYTWPRVLPAVLRRV